MTEPTLRLTGRRAIEAPSPREPVTSYHAHGWELRFHDPFEILMGNYAWQLSLFHGDVDVTAAHPYLWKVQAGRRLDLPGRYLPWCSVRPVVAINILDAQVRTYDVVTRRDHTYAVGELPREIQWSPRGERLAVTLYSKIVVIDTTDESTVAISVPIAPESCARLFWWPDGEHVLVVSRPAPAAKTELFLVRAADGRVLARTDFDPADWLPYDADACRAISRKDWSLAIGEPPWFTMAYGSLLDDWNQVDFDPATRLLRAYGYRPIGGGGALAPGQSTCVVEQRGVEVEVEVEVEAHP